MLFRMLIDLSLRLSFFASLRQIDLPAMGRKKDAKCNTNLHETITY